MNNTRENDASVTWKKIMEVERLIHVKRMSLVSGKEAALSIGWINTRLAHLIPCLFARSPSPHPFHSTLIK